MSHVTSISTIGVCQQVIDRINTKLNELQGFDPPISMLNELCYKKSGGTKVPSTPYCAGVNYLHCQELIDWLLTDEPWAPEIEEYSNVEYDYQYNDCMICLNTEGETYYFVYYTMKDKTARLVE
jgi:hypothetical protein